MKLKKLVAGILSAVMIGASLCAIPASAEATETKTLNLIKVSVGSNGYSKAYAEDNGYIEVGKAGNLTIDITIKGRAYVDQGDGVSNIDSAEVTLFGDSEMFGEKWEKATIDGKIFTKPGIKTTGVSIWGNDLWEDYYRNNILILDENEHKIQFTYKVEKKKYSYSAYTTRENVSLDVKISYPSGGAAAKETLPATKLSASAKKNVLTLTWDKVSGAEKYQVVYSTDGGKTFKTYKTYKSTATKSSFKMTKGTTYKFKVRSYKIVNGKKVYSKYSNVKVVKY